MSDGLTGDRVSSTRCGGPQHEGVAPASTYNHRGVMTAVPKDTLLGLIRWIFTGCCSSDMDFQNSLLATGYHLARAGLTAITIRHGSAAERRLRECFSNERAAGMRCPRPASSVG